MYPNPRNRGYEADQYEKENEEKMGVLHNRISNLKNITIAIGDEVRDQNRALDLMQGGFGDTDNLIGSTMKKMQVVIPNGIFSTMLCEFGRASSAHMTDVLALSANAA